MRLQTLYFPAFLDILSSHTKSFFITALLSGMAIVLQLIAIQTFIMISSNSSESLSFFGENSFFDFFLNSNSSIWGVFIFSGILSVFTMYVIKKISINVMIGYEILGVKRLAIILAENSNSKKLDYGVINILMTKDCRFGGRMAYELSNVVFPISALILIFPYLMFLEIGLTVLIFALLLFVGASQLIFSNKSEEIASNMELHAKEDKIAKHAFLQLLEKGEYEGPKSSSSIPSPLFMETYKQRLMIPHKGNLIGGAQFIIVLAIIGAWFSFVSVQSTPADILVYSVICLFAFSQAKTIPKSLANSIVFFSYYKRAFYIFLNPDESEFCIAFDKEDKAVEVRDIRDIDEDLL